MSKKNPAYHKGTAYKLIKKNKNPGLYITGIYIHIKRPVTLDIYIHHSSPRELLLHISWPGALDRKKLHLNVMKVQRMCCH